ncbi:MAG: hypothetical protein GXP47_13420, partial [Acidobacteria bacterium]|nr:hypothetical protein [Acidobacteriota bacterium]
EGQNRERGSALLLALLVALVLSFLGMGLLLQTSLGLQAAGTDRWVVKSLSAADAGLMMEINLIQMGFVADPASYLGGAGMSFILQDNPSIPGMLRGQYTVTIKDVCEAEPPVAIEGSEQQFQMRFLHVRSEARRSIGGLTGGTAATVEADVTVWPFDMTNLVPVARCY